MNVLLTGGHGLVGSHFYLGAQKTPHLTIVAPTHIEMNLTDQSSVERWYEHTHPDVVVHFAAYTDVSRAEQQRDNMHGACWQTNVVGTKVLAHVHQQTNCPFIYISTDAVFAGRAESPGPYAESAPIEHTSAHVSWYGWTKIIAEQTVQELIRHYTIVRIANPVRTQSVGNASALKRDYLQKILNWYDAQQLPVFFRDQYLTLTDVSEVTEVLLHLLHQPQTGILHVSSRNTGTPLDIATYLLEKARHHRSPLSSGLLGEYLKQHPHTNRYVQFGGLDTHYTQAACATQFKTWQEIIDAVTAIQSANKES